MPLYNFTNSKTGEDEGHFLPISGREQFLKDNPHLKEKLATPAFGDSVRLGIRRPDDNFNDVLLKAKGAHRHSTIETK